MVQVIKYKCCGQIFAACCEPACYTEKDWLKNMRKYALRGDKVEMMESGNVKLGKCECAKVEAPKSPDLFSTAELSDSEVDKVLGLQLNLQVK